MEPVHKHNWVDAKSRLDCNSIEWTQWVSWICVGTQRILTGLTGIASSEYFQPLARYTIIHYRAIAYTVYALIAYVLIAFACNTHWRWCGGHPLHALTHKNQSQYRWTTFNVLVAVIPRSQCTIFVQVGLVRIAGRSTLTFCQFIYFICTHMTDFSVYWRSFGSVLYADVTSSTKQWHTCQQPYIDLRQIRLFQFSRLKIRSGNPTETQLQNIRMRKHRRLSAASTEPMRWNETWIWLGAARVESYLCCQTGNGIFRRRQRCETQRRWWQTSIVSRPWLAEKRRCDRRDEFCD